MPMDPMSMGGSIGGSAGSVLGAIVGEIWGSGDDRIAEEKMKEAQALIDNLDIPSVDKQRVKLQLAEFAQLGPSAMEGVKVDPMFEGVQKQALATYQQQSQGVGTDAQARAAQYQGMRAAGQAAAARQGAIRQDMAARGLRGSGVDLKTQLLAGQQEADAAAGLGYQAAADSEARRTQATDKSAALAGSMGDTSFNRQSAVAQARDRVAAQNAQALNQNREYNANNANQEQVYNSRLIGENYGQQLERARLQAAQRQGQMDYYINKGNRKRGIATDVGNLAGTGAGMAIGGM